MTEVWGREALISLLLTPWGHPQFNRPAFTCSQSRSRSVSVTQIIRVCPPFCAGRAGVPLGTGLQVVNGSQLVWSLKTLSSAMASLPPSPNWYKLL